MALNKAKEIVSSTPVVIFGKTYCGYCNRVKQLFTQLGAAYNAIELDAERDGYEIQSALAEWTRQRTVPNVFIGGSDEVLEMHQSGTLNPCSWMLEQLLITQLSLISSSQVSHYYHTVPAVPPYTEMRLLFLFLFLFLFLHSVMRDGDWSRLSCMSCSSMMM